MIGMIKGAVAFVRPPSVTVDVHGVGYNVFVPVSLLGTLEPNSEVVLFTYMLVREDRIHLYGFKDQAGRELFEVLLSVSGLGAHSALLLLSHFTPDELVSAIRNEDTSMFVRIPGIGQKKAEKIIFEMKSREKKFSRFMVNEPAVADSGRADVIAALCALGFEEKVVVQYYTRLFSKGDPVETTIKKILRAVSVDR